MLLIAPFGFAPPLFLNAATTDPPAVPPGFPAHPPELVREMVAVSHRNMKRVTELLQARPALAKASWDWRFGDHETALGGASHVGNREIAEYLIDQGDAPTLFSATMLGQLEVMKAMVSAKPGVQKTLGPHSIRLLAHAKAGGAAAEPVRRYLESLGEADGPASVPFSDEEMAALAGSYVFGAGASERIDVTVNKPRAASLESGYVRGCSSGSLLVAWRQRELRWLDVMEHRRQDRWRYRIARNVGSGEAPRKGAG